MQQYFIFPCIFMHLLARELERYHWELWNLEDTVPQHITTNEQIWAKIYWLDRNLLRFKMRQQYFIFPCIFMHLLARKCAWWNAGEHATVHVSFIDLNQSVVMLFIAYAWQCNKTIKTDQRKKQLVSRRCDVACRRSLDQFLSSVFQWTEWR